MVVSFRPHGSQVAADQFHLPRLPGAKVTVLKISSQFHHFRDRHMMSRLEPPQSNVPGEFARRLSRWRAIATPRPTSGAIETIGRLHR